MLLDTYTDKNIDLVGHILLSDTELKGEVPVKEDTATGTVAPVVPLLPTATVPSHKMLYRKGLVPAPSGSNTPLVNSKVGYLLLNFCPDPIIPDTSHLILICHGS